MTKLILKTLQLDPFTFRKCQSIADERGVTVDDVAQELLVRNLQEQIPAKSRPALKRVK